MKRSIAMVALAALAGLVLAGQVWAAGWGAPSTTSRTESSGVSKTLNQINSGTKKFVQGTIDLVTLKPLRQGKTKSTSSNKPWLNNTYKKRSSTKKDNKDSFWTSWFKSDPKPKRTETIKDFIGRERPS